MKNLLYISEQEKKNIMRMHGILNEEDERTLDGNTWGYRTGDTEEKLYFDQKNKEHTGVWTFQELINTKFKPKNNEAEIEVWSSGCDESEKVCRNVTKHKMTFVQQWNKEDNEFILNRKYYYSNNEPSIVGEVNWEPLYYNIPRLDITTFDRPNFIISLFGSEADAQRYRTKKVASGFNSETSSDGVLSLTKDDVNMIYFDNDKEDKNYRYFKSGNEWFARNKTKNGPVFNLSKKAENNPAFKKSIDNLNAANEKRDGKKLEEDSSN